MSNMTAANVLRIVNDFMIGKSWQSYSCETCGNVFYLKPSSMMDKSNCGRGKCNSGSYAFKTLLKRNRPVTPKEVNDKLSGLFQSLGFISVSPKNIENFDSQTELVIAGVQMFDDIIHKNQPIRMEKMFVAQPSVRMQFQPHVQSQDGISTSFVNVCTEKMGVELKEHLLFVDQWYSALSKLGLHMNNFSIVMRNSLDDWGTGEFTVPELFFVYGGLELGDAAYRIIPQSDRAPLPISDIGFGLERIVWAMNKTESYFDTLMPLTFDGPREMFDSCRTLVLLALCGVRASNKGAGLQFRRFAKVISEKYYKEDVYQILRYYFDYWSSFIKPSISKDSALWLVRLEAERLINLKVCDELKLPPPREETTENYFNRLVYTHNVSIYDLRKAIKTCKI